MKLKLLTAKILTVSLLLSLLSSCQPYDEVQSSLGEDSAVMSSGELSQDESSYEESNEYYSSEIDEPTSEDESQNSTVSDDPSEDSGAVEPNSSADASEPSSEQSPPADSSEDASSPDYSYDEPSEEPSVFVDVTDYGNGNMLIISEVMGNNDCLWDYKYEDWIELYNPTDSSISLSDYRISDDEKNYLENEFPDMEISPKSYATFICSKLGFSVSKTGETLYLYSVKDETLSQKFSFGACEKNTSYTKDGINKYPSPGFENTYNGYKSYRESLNQKLVINEIIASNSTVYPQNGKYYDLIELKNISSESINLSNYYLSDKKNELFAHKLPNVTLNSGEFYVVVADGVNTPFKLSASGECVYLTEKGGAYADALWFESCPAEVSYGRSGSEYLYFTSPSFGKENGTGGTEIVSNPIPSVKPGIYNSAFSVSFTGSGTMYYTTDGTEPTTSSAKYTGAIPVNKNISIRIKAYDGNKIPSKVVTCAYFINETSNLPLLKMSCKDSDIWSTSSGIYANPTKSWTKEINLSFFVNGREEFSIDCGLSMFGSTGRYESKKSFKVKFRSEYGAASLKYKVFENLDIDSFTDLVIRGGSQDWYFSGVRDELATSLALSANTKLLVQSYRPVILYINDEYMGIYFIRERINEDFVASHHDTSPDDAAIIRYGYRLEKGTESDLADWNALINFIKTKDLSKAENYAYVCERLDVECLADWYIFRGYAGDLDIDNIRYYRENKNAKWKLIFFDLDLGFFGTKSPLTKITGTSSSYSSYNVPVRYLKKSPEFCKLFLERVYYHGENTLADEYVLARIDLFEDMLEEDIPENNARWEEAYIADGKGSYFNYKFWVSMMNYLRNIVKKGDHSRIELLIDDAEKVFG